MRALVVGGGGNIGQALCTALLTQGHEVVKTLRPAPDCPPVRYRETAVELDLREPALPEDLLWGVGFTAVYLVAAITGIMRSETDPDAWRVNAEAPVLLAQQAVEQGWHPVFISSGTVERAQHIALARQKAYADLGILMLGGCVVRPLPWVPPDKYDALANLLVQVGKERRSGVVRWEG